MLQRRKDSETKKLGWLLFTRLLLALFSIVLITITDWLVPRESYYPAYWLLVGVCFADLAYLIIYRLRGGSDSFATTQIALDVVFITVLIFVSGASRSNFSFLYYAVVLAAASLISKRSAIFFASLATVLLSCVTISYYLAEKYETTLPLVSPNWVKLAKINLGYVLTFLVAQGVALHLVGFLAGQLALRAADVRALYGWILDNMTQGMLVIDMNRRLLYANREAARLLGISSSPVPAGSRLDDILPQAQESRVRRLLLESGDGAVPEMQFETTDADPGLNNVEVKTSTLLNSRGKRVGTIVLFTDLSLRRRLAETQKRVERLQEVEEMSAGLAHEIRNPLASIRGCTQELGKLEFDDETNKKLAAIICRESDRLDKIVNDFLNLAKMKPPVFSKTGLANLIEEVIILLRLREDAAGLDMTNEVPENTYVYCDPEQIRQVLLNLGINAIEAVDHQGEIAFSASPASEEERTSIAPRSLAPQVEGVAIEVVDNGHGISAADLPKVFTPFFTTKQKGTGMGLAIANKIVADHNGLLELYSTVGEGTRVRLWLPVNPKTALRRDRLSWIQQKPTYS